MAAPTSTSGTNSVTALHHYRGLHFEPALGSRAGCPLTLGGSAHARTEGDPRRFVGLEVNHRGHRRFGVAAEDLSSAA
jgi:hypothetical protein